ncbi:MAG: DUF2085 domain-containing protein [Bacteroidota bacterium]
MSRSPHLTPPTTGWALFTPLVAGVVVLAFLPPFVDGLARAGLMHGFSFVCHQLPERSFAIGGVQIALCHRCTGILGGMALGLVLAPLLVRLGAEVGQVLFARVPSRHRAAVLFLLALVPTTVDWSLGASGVWANTPASRIATGTALGLVAGLLIGRAFLAPPARSHSLTHT